MLAGMYNSDTELLFPPRVIPTLLDLRGEIWNDLITRALRLESTDRDRMAFVLLMIRLGGCTTCTADSFRAMRGCTQCARQTIRRFRGSDQDLKALFGQARQEIDRYLETGTGS
jgi:hypothetical protein